MELTDQQLDIRGIECFIDDIYIIEYIRDNFIPDQIFSTNQLEDWAEENGWVKD